mmetsp:Transcript_5410/g.17955  ORF Transcript_5410/g.17955 Transcript_5410/m.17955 type:complete len:254 (+) Transcript_5410:524-1285(+)
MYVIVRGSSWEMSLRADNAMFVSTAQRTSTFGSHEWFNKEGAAYNAVPEPVPETLCVIATDRVSANDDSVYVSISTRPRPWPWSWPHSPVGAFNVSVTESPRPWSWPHALVAPAPPPLAFPPDSLFVPPSPISPAKISTLNTFKCIRECVPTYQSWSRASRLFRKGCFFVSAFFDEADAAAFVRRFATFAIATPRTNATLNMACSSSQSSGATPFGKFTLTRLSVTFGETEPCAIVNANLARASGNFKPCVLQ